MTDDNATPDAPKLDFDPVPALVTELGLPSKGVAAVVALLDEGNTVPFIARYRKERTGGLDEVQIRAIEEKRSYLVELEERRAAILASVAEQGKLTPELEAKLRAATGKSELEDLYAPYRPRRKTRASVARDRGLEPLAQKILGQGAEGDPGAEAAAFVGEHVATADDALAGARDIVAEMIADTAEVRAFVRREFAEHGELVSEVVPGKDNEPTKFEQYYHFKEAVKAIPSHRFLAIRRGEAEGVLRGHVSVDAHKVEGGILRLAKLDETSPWAAQLRLAAADALKRLLSPSVENDVRSELKQRSDTAAVEIFAGNLRNLMLAAPIGPQAVVGVDPGLRTGCKCAAIDTTGKFLGTVTIYTSQGDAQLAKAKDDFLAFVREHKPRAIAVGNGTGGREAEAFIKKTLADAGMRGGPNMERTGEGPEARPNVEPTGEGPESPAPFVLQVNEAGASVYSASDIAREEFPELDLTIRGAISIARRLQDPLAELVKIEPKSIGVGQYQHDVHQPLLSKKLGDVVESCVNHVGVELNTASAMLLGYVAGIGKSLAKKLVIHRDTNGAFASRAQLMEVSGLGPKAFEQAAGFLRINGAQNPLDRSAVHPERYPLVEKMSSDLGVPLPELIGNQELVDKIDLSKYVDGDVGEPTLRDIAAELAKPGRDPREEFAPPKFRDDVTTMEDLKQGMVLEGIVTNVTAFGAFVDIGVHNDGLVHVSQLSDQFVKDPSEVVKVGQKLTVRVLEVDTQRKRIGLSAKKPQQAQPRGERQDNRGPRDDRGPRGGRGRGGGRPQQDQGPRQMQQGPQPQGDQVQGEARQGDQLPGDQRPMRQWRDRGPQPQGDQQARGEQQPRGDHNRGGDQQHRGDHNRGGDQNRSGDQQARGGDHNRGGDQQARGGDQQPRSDQYRGGDQNRGDQNRGGGQNRGGDQRPPQGDRGNQPRNDQRGPRADNRGGGGAPRGPRRDDRGPREQLPPQSPDQRQANAPRGDQGPGPRRDDRGPRRDDRGPRRDDRPADRRPEEPPPGYGISGFVNNPFAKLKGDGPKR
ncbi:MAG: Tex-like protein-like protein [Myxococcales bacterium]|nr:Tex-like protein-like protein [Myxococcales bacterium]